MTTTADVLREEVRRRYAESARAVTEQAAADTGCGCGSGGCCADDATESAFGEASTTPSSAAAPGCRRARFARLRQSDHGRGPARGRDGHSTSGQAAAST